MKILARFALIIGAAALPSCDGKQAQIAALGATPQSRGTARSASRNVSWMLLEAKNEDLLYISDLYGVHVFSYPKGLHVGDISGFASPAGLCSNQAGDVLITDTSTHHVYEYAHGSTKRLKTLYDNSVDFNPIDCSVDPTSGNVAVSSADATFVVVFPKAKNKPKAYYEDMSGTHMFFCAYDDIGNLFVDQVSNHRNNYIGELPKRATRFKNYLLDRRIAPPGGIQFDGRHVVIEALGSHIVYRLRFSGSKAVVIGSTPLNDTEYVDQYWIQGKTLIGPDANSTVYLWNYPGGGSPLNSIDGFTLNYGSTVSASP